MDFEYSPRTKELLGRVRSFMDRHVYPNVERYERELAEGPRFQSSTPLIEELTPLARSEGLWNLFMPPHSGADPVSHFEFDGPGLSNLEYAPIAEETGRVLWVSQVFNCAAPDTGNMELLLRFGTREQQEKWLRPLMNLDIRSAFLMTEPAVASSDATNIETEIRREGDEYVINGRKWWSSGIGDPRCKVAIVMGKTDKSAPRHLQQSQVLVPFDTPGVKVSRMLTVFGYDDSQHGGHGEVILDNVRVPVSNLILGEGRGFEIAQGRLGPGRIHHCMRMIGAAEGALELMTRRLVSRHAFGKRLADHSVWEERVAEARVNIEMSRLLCLKAAYMMDTVGNKVAKNEIAMIKVAAPRTALKILDDAIQAHGGAGVSSDFSLAASYASLRTLRIADGPDEVHNRTIARNEFAKYAPPKNAQT
jgi:acyl-CoA dehydrogenase